MISTVGIAVGTATLNIVLMIHVLIAMVIMTGVPSVCFLEACPMLKIWSWQFIQSTFRIVQPGRSLSRLLRVSSSVAAAIAAVESLSIRKDMDLPVRSLNTAEMDIDMLERKLTSPEAKR